MQSFPKFLRSEPAVHVQDSAFPPFKIEHRYKGVYERAGFDVNTQSGSKSPLLGRDERSIHSKSSKTSTRHRHQNQNQSQNPIPNHKYPTPPKSTSPTSTKSSPLSPLFNPNKGNYQTAASTPNISLQQQPFQQQRNNSLPQNQYQQPFASNSQHSLPQQNSQSQIQNSNQSYQPQKKHGYAYGYPANRNPYEHQPPLSAPAASSFAEARGPRTLSDESQNTSVSYNESIPAHVRSNSQATSPSTYDSYATRPAVDDVPPPDDFNFSPNANIHQAKNFKNLHLDLGNQNPDIDSLSDSENEANPMSPKHDSFNDTKNTSVDNLQAAASYRNDSQSSSSVASQKFDPRQRRHQQQKQPSVDLNNHLRNGSVGTHLESTLPNKRLSTALDDFKHDVEEHKNASKPTISIDSTSKPNVPYPTEELSYGSPVMSEDPSKQFDEFRANEHSKDSNLSTDYQRFLGGETSKINRTSQLSMVSSIISKDSMYANEDDEVEKELERQLESLKLAGNSSNLEKNEAESIPSQHSPVHHNYVAPPSNTSPIPVFNIEDTDNVPARNVESVPIPTITTTSPEETIEEMESFSNDPSQVPLSTDSSDKFSSDNLEEFDDLSSNASFTEVKPLSVRHSYIPPLNNQSGFDSSETRNVQFNAALQGDDAHPVNFNDSSPESVQHNSDMDDVKPLSPKNHQVEEELKGINFRMAQEDPEEEEEPLTPVDNLHHHAKNSLPYPIDSQLPRESYISHHSFETVIHAPGEGPCRSCQLDIKPDSRGSQKSIYSKTGELSGQWHRACFSCNQEGCNIQFNKHVQCYAYNDRPYCNHHYHQLNDTICEHCSIGIEGECIENEVGQKWHLACLRCHKCHNNIKDDYYLINGSIICENDALRIINGTEQYSDSNGNIIAGGLSTQDKIEKRRTRLLFVD